MVAPAKSQPTKTEVDRTASLRLFICLSVLASSGIAGLAWSVAR